MYISKSWGALALATSAFAQTVTYSPGDEVSYAVNVPASTAENGSGDIYFQISGPTTMSWIGFGQGSQMKGSNIFMIYANADGTNVTLSPRLGTGEQQPDADTSAEVTLLDGSGISNDMMVANVRCSNCNSWSGGTMSFTDSTSSWIYAYKTGSAIDSDSVSASVSQHSQYGTTTLNLQNAAGGSSSNPFTSTADSTSSNSSSASSSSPSSASTASSSSGGGGGTPGDVNMVIMAHAILAPLAFVLFFPMGAMMIRLLSFKGVVWLHAGWMVTTYIIVLGAMGMGVWIAVVTQQLDTYHSIIGLIVVGALLLQPVSGITHHLLYKKTGGANVATYPHIWWGRAIVTLGIINGGFGLQLSDNTTQGEVAYAIVASVMWTLWMVVIVFSFAKSRRTVGKIQKKDIYTVEMRNGNSSTERMRYAASIEQNSPPTNYYNQDEWPTPQASRRYR
ncbi:iron reductase domain protein [Hyaloscypha variabilis]